MHGHEVHIVILFLQLLIIAALVLKRSVNKNPFVVLLLFIAAGVFSSPFRFTLAHHHQSESASSGHACCQPLISVITPYFEVLEPKLFRVSDSSKETSIRPFLIDYEESIRGPPLV